MEDEGIKFVTNANVGVNVKVEDLRRDFDAIVLCGGATKARDLPVPGRELNGIHLAMDYLPQQNKVNLGDDVPDADHHAKGKHVIILGGGDTGADCLGTSHPPGLQERSSSSSCSPRPPEDARAGGMRRGRTGR